MVGDVAQIRQEIGIIGVCSNVRRFTFVVLPQMFNFHYFLQSCSEKIEEYITFNKISENFSKSSEWNFYNLVRSQKLSKYKDPVFESTIGLQGVRQYNTVR